MRRAICLTAMPLLLLPLAAAGERPNAPQQPAAKGATERQIDLILTGGQVIDGTGAPAQVTEIGVDGDRILYIGPRPSGISARRIVDARGLTITPGFIDLHTHSGADALSNDPDRRQLAGHLLQGVTSIVIGNDGGGGTADIGTLFNRLSATQPGPNIASFIGFGDIRRKYLGTRDIAPTPEQLAQMQASVTRAMCDGALGLSTGLFYAPQSFAKTDEVVALAKIAGSYGGIYDTHLRDEGSSNIGLIPAIDEAIGIARSAGIPLHIAHIKALGADVQKTAPQVIAHIAKAQASGVTITADQYPWEASGTSLSAAIMPRWSQDGGSAAMVQRLKAITPELRAEMTELLRVRGGANSILLRSGVYKGKRLDALATDWGVAPIDAVARILIAEPGASIVSFNMAASDIVHFALRPWVVTASDSSNGHPRRTGSFARAWRIFVREQKLITPERFVQRSSAQTASILGIAQRGVLAPGNFADIALFDAQKYSEQSTYDAPDRLATGMHYVLVNGKFVVDRGKLNHALPGRPLPKARQPHWSCPA